MIIAVDAMGGDNAPAEIVRGAVEAVKAEEGFDVLLIGDAERITGILSESGYKGDRIRIRNTTEVITNEDVPTKAIKNKKDSSLHVGFDLVKANEADCLISAGSSGALLAGSVMLLKRIPGVDRPAVATAVPSGNGNVLLIDSGFNTSVKPVNYVQFGLLGSAYMRAAFGSEDPRVGLINIGVEEEKGDSVIKEANMLLKNAKLNYVGNVESRDFFNDVIDVAVTDGFTGNVMLKLIEGASEFLLGEIKKVFSTNARTKIGAAMVAEEIKGLKQKVDTDILGGAPVLGIDRLIIKSHGSSKARTIKYVILKAKKLIGSHFIEDLRTRCDELFVADREERKTTV
ncbi:MAG: phosphate acyltransferase PlsX [Clostridia bacterium]|nr:phosphate acyltransferase PlsX [Clostridia bacterium]